MAPGLDEFDVLLEVVLSLVRVRLQFQCVRLGYRCLHTGLSGTFDISDEIYLYYELGFNSYNNNLHPLSRATKQNRLIFDHSKVKIGLYTEVSNE